MTGAGPGRARRIGLAAVVLWFRVGSIAHLVATDVEVRLVPPYPPWPRAAVLVSGCGWPACVAPSCARPAWRCAGRALPGTGAWQSSVAWCSAARSAARSWFEIPPLPRRLRAAHWRHAAPPASGTGPTASGLRPG